jgi:hypothetical protein
VMTPQPLARIAEPQSAARPIPRTKTCRPTENTPELDGRPDVPRQFENGSSSPLVAGRSQRHEDAPPATYERDAAPCVGEFNGGKTIDTRQIGRGTPLHQTSRAS